MFVTNSVTIDNRVMKEAATLAGAGHEVTVFGMVAAGEPAAESVDGFRVERVAADTLHGAEAAPGASGRSRSPLAMAAGLLRYFSRALAAATRERFEAYHAHDLVTLPLGWMAARRRRARLVYDAHELFTEIGRLGGVTRAGLRLVERALIGRADRVITVNDSIAAEMARRYRVTPLVLRNCPRTSGPVPEREASPLRRWAGVPEGAPVVLYQGLYTPNRGLENLVRAVRHFRAGHLVFLGWGPLLEPLRALAREEGVAGRVSFAEPVPIRDLLAYTAGADLGVIPYRNVGLNNFYASPNKLFEYCVAGVPVVASRFPELVRVVEDLGLGLTFDPEQPEEIAAAVNALLLDPAALRRARENARRAAPGFTWERESRKLLEAYEGLGRPAPPRSRLAQSDFERGGRPA